MGTRADFYVGRGPEAEWLGSIGWDGYPGGKVEGVMAASTEVEFRQAVAEIAATEDDFTAPERGWPWPWDDSNTTDYAYAFDGKVWLTCFGAKWVTVATYNDWVAKDTEGNAEWDDMNGEPSVFPDMSASQNVTFGKRSGLIIFTSKD